MEKTREGTQDRTQGLQVITFTVGEQEFALEISLIREIDRVGSITNLPHLPPHVVGVINLRGAIVPVVDLRLRLGLEARPVTKVSRIIVVEGETGPVGLLVDAVYQVMNLPPDKLLDPPEGFSSPERKMVRKIAKVGERLILIPELASLIMGAEGRRAESVEVDR